MFGSGVAIVVVLLLLFGDGHHGILNHLLT